MNKLSLNKFKSIKVILILLTCFLIALLSIYLSKIKIYEDILVTYHPENNSLDGFEIIGTSVFDKEVVLLKANQTNISLENYYLKNLTLILYDSVITNKFLQLHINTNQLNIDLSKPNKTLNNRNYYNLNYKTNGNVIAKIRYVLKCNYVNFSNIFKEKILYKVNIQSTFLFINVLLAIVFLFLIKNLNFLIHNGLLPNIINLRKNKKIKFKKLTLNYSLYSLIITVLIFFFIIHILTNLIEYNNISFN